MVRPDVKQDYTLYGAVPATVSLKRINDITQLASWASGPDAYASESNAYQLLQHFFKVWDVKFNYQTDCKNHGEALLFLSENIIYIRRREWECICLMCPFCKLCCRVWLWQVCLLLLLLQLEGFRNIGKKIVKIFNREMWRGEIEQRRAGLEGQLN